MTKCVSYLTYNQSSQKLALNVLFILANTNSKTTSRGLVRVLVTQEMSLILRNVTEFTVRVRYSGRERAVTA